MNREGVQNKTTIKLPVFGDIPCTPFDDIAKAVWLGVVLFSGKFENSIEEVHLFLITDAQ